MNKDQIRSALIETLTQIAPEGDFDALKPDRPVRDQLDIDSFDFLRWMVLLSERLGVEIAEADYPKLATFNGAIDHLAARTQNATHLEP
jgi:acyl carrier protein